MIEVLKQMVEALEWCHGGEPIGTTEAIKLGKQAIAELEKQKPMAWVNCGENIIERVAGWDGYGALYTHPPQRTWVGLTKEDKDLIEDLCEMMIGDAVFSTIDAILKGKNT